MEAESSAAASARHPEPQFQTEPHHTHTHTQEQFDQTHTEPPTSPQTETHHAHFQPLPPAQAAAPAPDSGVVSMTIDTHNLTATPSQVPGPQDQLQYQPPHNDSTNPFHAVQVRRVGEATPRTPILVNIAQAVIILSGIACIGLMAYLLSISPYMTEYYGLGALVVIVPACLSLLWALVSLTISRPFRVRVHPGIYVGLDLVLFLALISVGGMGIADSMYSFGDCYNNGYYRSSYSRVNREQCIAVRERLTALQLSGSCLAVLNAALHFGIMVWACRAVHVMKKEQKFQVSIDLRGLAVAGAGAGATTAAKSVYYA